MEFSKLLIFAITLFLCLERSRCTIFPPKSGILSLAIQPLQAYRLSPTSPSDFQLEQIVVEKSNLSTEMSLPLKYLRLLDSTSAKIRTSFFVRPNVLILCLDKIRIVLRKGEALLFSDNQDIVSNFLNDLRVELSANRNPRRSFELLVLEKALLNVCGDLRRIVVDSKEELRCTIDHLHAESKGLDAIKAQVDELLPLKNKIDKNWAQIKRIKSKIGNFLNSEQNLRYLGDFSGQISSLKSPPRERSQDVDQDADQTEQASESNRFQIELLLESYLQHINYVHDEIEEISDEITNTEESFSLQLDFIRNRMMKFELFLSIASFIAATGACISGIFGMNFLNHLEQNKYIFSVLVILISVSMKILFDYLISYAVKERLL